MKVCDKCGNIMGIYDNFCSQCGNDLRLKFYVSTDSDTVPVTLIERND